MFSHMFSLFKPNISDQETKMNHTSTLSQAMKKAAGYNFKKILKFTLGCSFLTTAHGYDICFETNNNDNRVNTNNPEKTFDALVQACGAYRDGYDDCADWFTERECFGKSFFGYPSCVWYYHEYDIYNPCIQKVLREVCPSDGTLGSSADPWWDYVTLAAVLAVGSCVCSCGVSACSHYYSQRQENQTNQEATTLTETKESPVENDYFILPATSEDVELTDSRPSSRLSLTIQ